MRSLNNKTYLEIEAHNDWRRQLANKLISTSDEGKLLKSRKEAAELFAASVKFEEDAQGNIFDIAEKLFESVWEALHLECYLLKVNKLVHSSF